MAMVANDPKAAKRLGIPQSVGRDYVEADKGRKFGDDNMKSRKFGESKAMMKKEVAFMKKKGAPKSMIRHEEKEMKGEKVKKFSGQTGSYVRRSGPTSREATGPTSGRATYFPNPFGKSIKVYTGPTGGGQSRTPSRNPSDLFGNENPNFSNEMAAMEEESRMLEEMRRAKPPTQMARGGKVHSRMKPKAAKERRSSAGGSYRKQADGIANKGKTKGKIVKMMMGGKC